MLQSKLYALALQHQKSQFFDRCPEHLPHLPRDGCFAPNWFKAEAADKPNGARIRFLRQFQIYFFIFFVWLLTESLLLYLYIALQ